MFRVNSNRPRATAVGSKKYHVARPGTYGCVKLPILCIPARRGGNLTLDELEISTVELSVSSYVRAAHLPDEGLVVWGRCVMAHAEPNDRRISSSTSALRGKPELACPPSRSVCGISKSML